MNHTKQYYMSCHLMNHLMNEDVIIASYIY